MLAQYLLFIFVKRKEIGQNELCKADPYLPILVKYMAAAKVLMLKQSKSPSMQQSTPTPKYFK